MLATTLGVGAQNQQKYIAAAHTSYQYGDYANAAYYYGIALEFDSTDVNLRFRRAESNLNYRAFKLALEDFAKIPPGANDSLPYLQGKAEQPLGGYEAAEDYFTAFLDNPGNASQEAVADARRQLANVIWARDTAVAAYVLSKEDDLQDRALPINYADVNSRYDDFAPYFERDQFYFSSLRFLIDKDSILPKRRYSHVFQRDSAEGMAINRELPEEINQKNITTAHSSFNTAGTMVYFTQCDYLPDTLLLRCDLYVATVSPTGTWGTPKKLNINDSDANNTHPNVGKHADGSEYLYFASDRISGKGMHDLYRAAIAADGSVGSVEALDELNTPFDEVTPFYYAPFNELYFSTDGRNTLGGLDVYRSTMDGDNWTTPFHLGLPTNSSYNDVYYTRFAEKDYAYFASNRHSAEAIFWDEEEDVCCNDIYKVEIGTVCLEVSTWNTPTDENSADVACNGTTLKVYDVTSKSSEPVIDTVLTGNRFEMKLEKKRKYRFVASKRGLKDAVDSLDLTKVPIVQPMVGNCLEVKLYLPPPKITLEVVTLNKSDQSPLNGCTVELFPYPDELNPGLPNPSTKLDSSFYTYKIALENDYEIFGSKKDYTSDTTWVDTRGLVILKDTIIKRQLLLEPAGPDICELQPQVFFHNDIPVKGDTFTTTPDDYLATYNSYLALEESYKAWAGPGTDVADELNTFFRNSVEFGAKNLADFAKKLKLNLDKGDNLTITLQGFASPLATSPYNDELSARRCISIINYLWNYDDGALQRYMQDAVILMYNKAHVTLAKKTYEVPIAYLGIPVVSYQEKDSPSVEKSKRLTFDIKPGGEVLLDSTRPDLVDEGDKSIYHPEAAKSRYVVVKVGGCPEPDIPESDTRKN